MIGSAASAVNNRALAPPGPYTSEGCATMPLDTDHRYGIVYQPDPTSIMRQTTIQPLPPGARRPQPNNTPASSAPPAPSAPPAASAPASTQP